MKKSLLFVFLFLNTAVFVFAQDNFKPGYIITNSSDTLRGWIDYRTDYMNSHDCYFKTDSLAVTTNYKPGQIAGFRYVNEGKYYVTHRVEYNNKTEDVFLEYLLQGKMNLYFYPDESSDSLFYFFEDPNGVMNGVSKYPEKTIKRNGSEYFYNDTKYRERIAYLLRDHYNELKPQIETLEFSHDAMIDVAKAYHDLACTTGESCIIFETSPDKKYFQFKYSVYAGGSYQLVRLPTKAKTMNVFSPIIGGIIDISIPRKNKHVSTFLDFSFQQSYHIWDIYSEEKDILFNINAGGKYMNVSSKISPIFEAGINIFSMYLGKEFSFGVGQHVLLGSGVNFKLKNSDCIFVKLNYKNFFPSTIFDANYSGNANFFELKFGYTF